MDAHPNKGSQLQISPLVSVILLLSQISRIFVNHNWWFRFQKFDQLSNVSLISLTVRVKLSKIYNPGFHFQKILIMSKIFQDYLRNFLKSFRNLFLHFDFLPVIFYSIKFKSQAVSHTFKNFRFILYFIVWEAGPWRWRSSMPQFYINIRVF